MLREITIKGYRSCADTHMEFRQPVTAIVGRNGVGKTSILMAIQWFARFLSSPEYSTANHGVTQSFPKSLDARFELNHEIYNYHFEFGQGSSAKGTNGHHVTELLVRVTADSEEVILERNGPRVWVEIEKTYTKIPFNLSAITSLSAVLAADHELVPLLDAINEFVSKVSYYQFTRCESTYDLVDESAYVDWMHGGQLLEDVFDHITSRIQFLHRQKPEIFEELKQLLGPNGLNLIDDIRPMSVTLPSVTEDDVPESKRILHYVLFVPASQMGGAGTPLRFSQLSQGTQKIVATMLSVLSEDRSLVLLEQPEDSIHSSILQKFVGLMRTYSVDQQLIFSTHSSDVLNVLRPDEILLATAPGGETSVRPLSSHEMEAARTYLRTEGTLAEFLESVDDSDDI